MHKKYKLSTLQVRISQENIINAMTQQLITAKISGCALKQGSKTYSSLRQSNLQLQNASAVMSCRIRAVEQRCSAILAGAHPGLQDQILLNYTRIENAHNVCRKICNILLCIEVQQTLGFLFLCWDIIKWMLLCEKLLFGQWLCWSTSADKMKKIVSDEVNYRGTQS